MHHIRVPWHGWVLVCDASKAMLLRNEGDAELLNLKPVDVFVEPHPPSHLLGTDRPGRVHQSHESARSAVEPTDLHLQAEEAFLAEVAAAVDAAVRAQKPKALIVVAPPKALGLLRRALTAGVQAIVTAEVAKDLAHAPIVDIEKHLAAS